MAMKKQKEPSKGPKERKPHQFEEYRGISSAASWMIILAFCASLVGWGLFNYWLIPDTPRQWDFGTLPDAPGESIYSTGSTPQDKAPPSQIPPLPEGQAPVAATQNAAPATTTQSDGQGGQR